MKTWCIVIGIDKFYLTEQEKNYYLTSINKGAKYVDLGGMVLGPNFQSLVSLDTIEESKQLEEGKFKCEYGRWHKNVCDCEERRRVAKLLPTGGVYEN